MSSIELTANAGIPLFINILYKRSQKTYFYFEF